MQVTTYIRLLEIAGTDFDDRETVSTPSQSHCVTDHDGQELEKENSPGKRNGFEGANKLCLRLLVIISCFVDIHEMRFNL